MKPYSIDFRQKIIEVYVHESLSIRKLAERFCVAKSFIQKLVKQYKQTGDLHPHSPGKSPEPKLKTEQLIDLVKILETNKDATLGELCHLLEEKTQVRVSRATMGRVTQKLNDTVKKNSLRRRKRK